MSVFCATLTSPPGLHSSATRAALLCGLVFPHQTSAHSERPRASVDKKSNIKQALREELISGVLQDGTLIETLFDVTREQKCIFVVKPPGQEPQEADNCEVYGVTVFPPERLSKFFGSGSVKMASGLDDYGDTFQLLTELKDFVHRYVDIDDFNGSLMAHWAMMTFCFDAFRAFPFLCLRGEPACGKSRALQVVGSICYRTIVFGGGSTKSALLRLNDRFRSTISLDEADVEGDLRSDFVKLLNQGYRIDGSVSMSVGSGDDYEPKIWHVGSPKLLANRLDFPDKATETRTLTIRMVVKELAKHVPAELPFQFEAEAQSLRNKLMKWRFDNFHQIPQQKPGASLRLLGLDGRAQQLGLPILTIAVQQEFKDEFLEYLRDRSGEMNRESPLHVVLESIVKLRSTHGDALYVSDVSKTAKAIATERELEESWLSPKRTAQHIRSLRFETARWGRGTVMLVDDRLLAQQARRFGLQAPDSLTE